MFKPENTEEDITIKVGNWCGRSLRFDIAINMNAVKSMKYLNLGFCLVVEPIFSFISMLALFTVVLLSNYVCS